VFKSFLSGLRDLYAWLAWQEERKVWSTVILLDVIRSVVKILDALADTPGTPHRLRSFLIRLSPLRRAQLDLEKYLGLAKGEEMCETSVPELVKKMQLHNPSLEDVEKLVSICRDDMGVLWTDDDVRTKLEMHEMRLDEHSRL